MLKKISRLLQNSIVPRKIGKFFSCAIVYTLLAVVLGLAIRSAYLQHFMHYPLEEYIFSKYYGMAQACKEIDTKTIKHVKIYDDGSGMRNLDIYIRVQKSMTEEEIDNLAIELQNTILQKKYLRIYVEQPWEKYNSDKSSYRNGASPRITISIRSLENEVLMDYVAWHKFYEPFELVPDSSPPIYDFGEWSKYRPY